MFQPKKMGIKLKLETAKHGQKDRVIGKQAFDVARFVGKENVIYEMTMEGAADAQHCPSITLDVSVVKYLGGGNATQSTAGGAGAVGEHDLIFNDSSEEEEAAAKETP